MMALMLACIMVLAMALPAMAASVTVKDATDSTHKYTVYQIFTGDLAEDGVTLSNLKYGANYVPEGTKTGDLVSKDEIDAITDARAFADNLVSGNKLTGTGIATLTKDNGFKAENLADGYYLIVDATEVALSAGDMYSRYIVQVSGDTEIAPKKSTVEEDKTIKSDTHSPSEVTTDKKADDLSIGEDVTYNIDAKIPLSAADYQKFYFIINDTLSEGLTLKTDSFVVKAKLADGTEKTLTENTDYSLFVNADGHTAPDEGKTFQVALKDAKSMPGATITVEYTATLNENAKIGETANKNETSVTYSNNPEHKFDGTPDEDGDGKPDEGENHPTGETPTKETRTYTSSIELKKVDENKAALQGAEFTITGTSVKTVLVTTDVYTEDADGTYYKLKDGSYTTAVPSESDQYVEKGKSPQDSGYVKDGETYRVATYDELRDGKTTIYKKVTANKDDYESTTTKYKKEKKSETQTKSENVAVKAFVDENGIVRFDGLGAGTYTISESTVPSGYNKIEDFTVTIKFNGVNADDDTTNDTEDKKVWSATSSIAKEDGKDKAVTEVKATNDETVDTFQIQVENKKGNVLPSTGGIGTTIFYVVGSLLVLAAGILLVTRRRMSAE